MIATPKELHAKLKQKLVISFKVEACCQTEKNFDNFFKDSLELNKLRDCILAISACVDKK